MSDVSPTLVPSARELGERAGSFTSVRDVIVWSSEVLGAVGVETPRVDAEILLAHALGVSRSELQRRSLLGVAPFAQPHQSLEFAQLLAQRAQRFPLQHLTGLAPFRYLELAVGPGVFVPRPETESVVQVGIDELKSRVQGSGHAVAVDLCTGSGAIALAMATEVPQAHVSAVELSKDAYTFTSRNNEAYGNLVELVRGDARTALAHLNGQVDVLVSNPPYVPPGAIPKDREVAEHDPALALYGLGEDGLEVPRGVTNAAARLLKPGGLYVMEHAEVQDQAARDMVSETNYFEQVETRFDLTNRPRMVVAYRNNVAYVEGSLK